MKVDAKTALANIPAGLRDELIKEFQKISRNFREQRWEAAELDGGRFSEVAYTVLRGYLDGGSYAGSPSKPSQFDRACQQLGQADSTVYPKSARVTMPRVLTALYDIRNNRGVGHVGGDVDANHMDAAYVLHSAQWVMAEFVRIFHNVNITAATATVDALVERTIPLIWRVGEVVRVLEPGISLRDATLLLMHSSAFDLTDKQLAKNLEQDSLSNYRRVLNKLHADRLIEYSRDSGSLSLSPTGVAYVEDEVLPRWLKG